MKAPAPRGKDGRVLGVGDIVDVHNSDGEISRATIVTMDRLLNDDSIRIFDAVVLWLSTGSTSLASTAIMTLISKADGDKDVL